MNQLEAEGIVVAIAGCFSLAAVFMSKISKLVNKKDYQFEPTIPYECGFRNENEEFKYISENTIIIILSIILELLIMLMLFYTILYMKIPFVYGSLFIKMLFGIFLMLLIFSYKNAFVK